MHNLPNKEGVENPSKMGAGSEDDSDTHTPPTTHPPLSVSSQGKPPPASAGMIPIGGNSRHGLPAMSQTGPLNLPIMQMSNPFNSALNNPLKAPA